MKSISKKSVSLVLVFALLMTIFMPTMVNAESSVSRIGTSKVGNIVMAYTAGNSQVYVNKITKSDGTVVRYVYSKNFLVTPESILKLKSVLNPEYSSLIPDNYSIEDNYGIKVCSDSSLVDSMDDNWKSSEWVARNVVAVRSVKSLTNEAGDGINQTAISNKQSLTVLFNEIKNNAENENRAKWEASEQERKASWDAAEATHQEEDPSYIPQEYVGSEYVPLDFGTMNETDIQNVKALENNQVAVSVGTQIATTYSFEEGKLIEVSNITIINHIASIYTAHTSIDDTENITKINTLNIGIASPKVGDTATATTKPTVTLDSNPNYEIEHIAYITAYPSEKPAGEYDAPFIGTFEADKDYVVEVSLRAKDGFTFVGNDGMTLKVNGKTTGFEKSEWNADGSTYYMFYSKVQATAAEDPTYEYIDNTANQTYIINKDDALTFIINADFSLFENGGKVFVDGKETKDFTASSGSTIITFAKDYVSSLSEGEHTLKVAFNDGGSATTKFTVAKANSTTEETSEAETPTPSTPQTGDDIVIWISLMIVSMLGVAGIIKYRKVDYEKKSIN